MKNKLYLLLICAYVLLSTHIANAQQAKSHRVGVIMQGGPYYEAIDGLRDGLGSWDFKKRKTSYWRSAIQRAT